jgi:hypothetical protein
VPKASPPRLVGSVPRRPQIPWRWVGVAFAFVALALVVHFVRTDRALKAERSRVLKQLGALKGSIQDDYTRVRDQVETWTVAAATKPYAGDMVDRDARAVPWRERPSIYLRMRVEDAKSVDAVHKNARTVALDAIPSCLLRPRAGGPWTWGEVVTRFEMLGIEYVKDVSSTTNDLRMRNLAYALDYYEKNDFPALSEALKKAEYLVLALDEDPTQIPATSAAFGPEATPAQRILSVPHPVRLQVWRLAEGREILRLRRTPEASVVQVQGDVVGSAAGVELRKAQALGCAVADETLEALGSSTLPSMSAAPAPAVTTLAPPASASASAAPSASASASTKRP